MSGLAERADPRGLDWQGRRSEPAQSRRASPSRPEQATRFEIDRVALDDDGYDYQGIHWGPGLPLWRFRPRDTDPLDQPAEGFVRAKTAAQARGEIARTMRGLQ